MNYTKLGLKAGLEIHQQLATHHKLFCKCSTGFSESPQEGYIKRKLRAVTGETGDIDIAARHESLQKKEFSYRLYPSESCMIEMDSEPPDNVNPEALEIAIEIALLLKCDIPDEIHIMRKTVIDGSNPTSFQRTVVVGMNGWMETSSGRVGILSVAVEEDSAQILKKGKEKSVFGLNRLGIPLVEIATAPDIHSPEQGKEVAEKLGMILRSSRVRRGLGTIRQDLNISIKNGDRVEVKGVQDLKGIPKIIEKEAARQSVSKAKKEVRKANPDGSTSFLRPLPGAARLYPETDCIPIRIDAPLLRRIRNNLPELLSSRRSRLEKELGLSQEMIKSLEKVRKLDLFRNLSKLKKVNHVFTAEILVSYQRVILRKNKGADTEKIDDKAIQQIFENLDKGEIAKDAVLEILTEISLGKKLDFSRHRLETVDVGSEVQQLLKTKPGLSFGAYMGILMKKLRGKVSGDEIAKALKKYLGT